MAKQFSECLQRYRLHEFDPEWGAVLRGIEKESLRISSDGQISLAGHPKALGSALTNPYITTDFFWERLQKVESYDPERTLLFDDSLPVLRQAQREGIRHLYGIKQPDSHRPEVEHDEFPLVEDFQQIMPSKQK